MTRKCYCTVENCSLGMVVDPSAISLRACCCSSAKLKGGVQTRGFKKRAGLPALVKERVRSQAHFAAVSSTHVNLPLALSSFQLERYTSMTTTVVTHQKSSRGKVWASDGRRGVTRVTVVVEFIAATNRRILVLYVSYSWVLRSFFERSVDDCAWVGAKLKSFPSLLVCRTSLVRWYCEPEA